jgi:hypothetical protein
VSVRLLNVVRGLGVGGLANDLSTVGVKVGGGVGRVLIDIYSVAVGSADGGRATKGE